MNAIQSPNSNLPKSGIVLPIRKHAHETALCMMQYDEVQHN